MAEDVSRETSSAIALDEVLQKQHRVDKVDAEVIADFLVVADGPEGEFAAFAGFQAADAVLQAEGAGAVDGDGGEGFVKAHAHG